MPTHAETRHLPYSAQQIYDLVADVARYPEFLPWCAGARIRSRRPDGAADLIEADLIIGFKVFREKFGSRVRLDEARHRIDTEYLDGPFRYMRSHWDIADAEGGCLVDFSVDFEMKNALLEKAVGAMWDQAMHRIVRAFETRAKELYG